MNVKEYMNINNYHYCRVSSYRIVKGNISKINSNTKIGDLKLYNDKKVCVM